LQGTKIAISRFANRNGERETTGLELHNAILVWAAAAMLLTMGLMATATDKFG
jgi:hypothetical protein